MSCRYIKIVAIAVVFMLLAGCGNKIAGGSIVGTYVYEEGGYAGPFIMTILEDGTFSYYVGIFSSSVNLGTWVLEDDVLVISDSNQKNPRVNYFKVDENKLVFQEAKSDNFSQVVLSDGERFIKGFTEYDADASDYDMPKEELKVDTDLLLEKFVDSDFIDRVVLLRVSSGGDELLMEYDFNTHNVFKELISRNDFLEVLNDYTKEIADSTSESNGYKKMCLFEILTRDEVAELVEKAEVKGEDLPYLYEWYEENGAKETNEK